MRPSLLCERSARLLLFLLAGCAGHPRFGNFGDGPFVPSSDGDLQTLLGDYPSPGANASDELHDSAGHVLSYPSEHLTFADKVIAP